MIRKKEGFNGQTAIVLPNDIQEETGTNELTKTLHLTDIGYYPSAKYHFRERPEGCEQHILIYCTEGKGWVETLGIRRKISPNMYFTLPAGMPHQYGADENTPWSIYWVHFKGEKSGLFSGRSITINTTLAGEHTRNDRRIRLFEEIIRNLSMGYSLENLEYSSICLWYLLGSFEYPQQFERIRTVQKDNIIEKSILYMNEHIGESIDLGELASHCGYSVSHFSLIFRKNTSRSPIEYFNGLKMQQACQMLDFTNMKVHEIATELAFDDPFYFSRLFRKIIGMSPADYRKKMKG